MALHVTKATLTWNESLNFERRKAPLTCLVKCRRLLREREAALDAVANEKLVKANCGC